MKKRFAILLTVILCLGLFAGCASQQSGDDSASAPTQSASEPAAPSVQSSESAPVEGETVNVAALKGPTAMGMVKLMDDAADGSDYAFTIAGSADEITPRLVQGELDIAAVPANLASVLYNNTDGQVQVVAVNTLGVLYIVESGDTVQSVEDLRGKTIYASGKGATPEFALNYILTKNGIDPEKDVTIEYKAEHTECVAALSSQENAIAMLPQPFVTVAQTKNEKIRIALDLNAEWDKLQENEANPSGLITGVLVARTEFVEQHPDQLNAFLDAYQASVAYVNANTAEAAALVGKYDIVAEQVAQKALPYCNITYIDGAEMQQKLGGYLAVLMEQNPQSIGGALPDEAFYYSR